MKDEFLKRLPSSAAEERAIVEALFGLPNTIREKAAAIRADGRLSDGAKADDIRQMAKGTPRQHLQQLRSRAAAMKADVQNRRLALKPKEVDRSDLYAEMQRRELRDHLKTLPAEQRLRAAMDDPAITEAVLNAPAALSGLSAEHLGLVRDGHMEKTFGPQLADIEKREAVLEVINSAVEIATAQFRRETGLAENEIDS